MISWKAEMIPRRFAPYLYGIIQSGLTTGIATFIATQSQTGFGPEFVTHWITAWARSWAVMLPIVVLLSPIIQRTVAALVRST